MLIILILNLTRLIILIIVILIFVKDELLEYARYVNVVLTGQGEIVNPQVFEIVLDVAVLFIKFGNINGGTS